MLFLNYSMTQMTTNLVIKVAMYLAFPSVSLCVHYRQERTHGQELPHLRALLSHLGQIWEIFACHIGAKECDVSWGFFCQHPLEEKRVGKDLPSKHVQCSKEDSMATDSNFKPFLIQFAGVFPGRLLSCSPT